MPSTWQKMGFAFDLPDYLTWRATGCDTKSLCSAVCKWTYQASLEQQGWNDSFWIRIGLEDLVTDNYQKIGKLWCFRGYGMVFSCKIYVKNCFMPFKKLALLAQLVVHSPAELGLWVQSRQKTRAVLGRYLHTPSSARDVKPWHCVSTFQHMLNNPGQNYPQSCLAASLRA